MATTQKTVKPDSDRQLFLSREFDAPVDLVYSLWAEPGHMEKWFHPTDFTIEESFMDFRPEGRWRWTIRSRSGNDYTMAGVYREIVHNRRIVFSHAWLDENGEPKHETLITVRFEDLDGRTRLSFHQAEFESESARDSHEDGWQGVLQSLQEHLDEALHADHGPDQKRHTS